MTEQTTTSNISEFHRANLNKPISPREFIFRYLKYLPWVLICVALGLVFAKIKIRYSPPIYKVQASLLINNNKAGGAKEDERLDQLFMSQSSANLSNEIEVIKSRPLLARVTRDLGLQLRYFGKGKIRSTMMYNDLPFKLQILEMPDTSKGFGLNVIVKDEEHFLVNENKTPNNFGQPFKYGSNTIALIPERQKIRVFVGQEFNVTWSPLINMAEALSASIKVVQVNNQSTILTLSQETPNIDIGEALLNTIMAVYDTLQVEDKNKIAYQTLRFIDNRLDTLRRELGGVQGALKIFEEKSQAFALEDLSKSYLDNLSKNEDTRMQQEVQLKVIDMLLDYIGNAQNNYKTVPVSLGITEPSLLQLIADYNSLQLQRDANLKTTTAANQTVKAIDASLEKLRGNIYEALKNIRQGYVISRDRISQKENELKGNLTALPGKSMQALNIQRQQKILEDLYSFLLQKKLETTISSASTISNSKVIEPARGNENPIKPDPRSIYLSYFLIGLIIPVSLIALIEIMNDKVSGRTEIEKNTLTPITGEIGHSDNSQTLVVTSNSRSFISEQFRIIRSNLQYIVGKKEKPTILITSSLSGEGKSFVSTNLGAVMALAGKKTVIMEFDIRKPKILSGLDLKRKMGITNYIIGKATFEELPVAVDGVENLYVIPCGPIPPNPAEILLDPRLKDLIADVKRNFDVVIMDTAPVGLVSDAIALSQFADCTMYIVRNKYTRRHLVGLIDELYTNKKLPSISILLNDINLGEGTYGGYYGGYGYATGYGYGGGNGYFEKEKGYSRERGLGSRLSKWFRKLFK